VIKSPRVRVFLGLVLVLTLLVIVVAFLQRRSGYYSAIPVSSPSPTPETSATSTPEPALGSPSQSENTPSPTASPSLPPTLTPPAENTPSPTLPIPPIGFVGTLKLIIPVAGVKPEQLHDTFADSRSEGRVHDAIDIPAPAGTPVLAAADGQMVKLFQSERGGTTIYQLSPNKKLSFYYAHLQSYAEGLYEGKFVRQGEVIGFVGDTGNAGPGNYHLHFSIMVISDPKHYWEGVNINPYPLLQKQ
jgi:murein DD-endopeptidase MepM/ murein hydrolase activator NlpD